MRGEVKCNCELRTNCGLRTNDTGSAALEVSLSDDGPLARRCWMAGRIVKLVSLEAYSP